MPSAVPTNGHPSRIAAINALKKQGLGPTKIGRQIGLSGRQVGHLMQSNRRAVVNFPRDTLEMLRPYAKKRRMSVSGLAIAIVFAAVDDGMVDAILDDAT